jgi:hypothetical protein
MMDLGPSDERVGRNHGPDEVGASGSARRRRKVRAPALSAVLLAFAAACLPPAAAAGEWSDYQIVIWQTQTPARYAGLQRLGVSAARVMGVRDQPDPMAPARVLMAPLQRAGLRCYVENIATDFYAAYHRWEPGRAVNWRFIEAQELHARQPDGYAAFIRQPSLSDAAWRRRIARRLAAHVRAYGPCRPLYYSLGDETGIADLAAAWDFDFSSASLAGMRAWLARRYGTLTALNRQWGSRFGTWNAVMPMTTDQALRRTDDNFSAWADFKAWMDVAFADAVRAGTAALHAADPAARSAIEGAQIPGWGGYDYSLLAPAVDAMEIYDVGNSLDIARSLNPHLIVLTTGTSAGAAERQQIWREALRGSRGLILWDEAGTLVNDDGSPGPRGQDLAETFAELRGGLGALLIASRPRTDGLAILYSPASFRLAWLLARRAEGRDWSERSADTEGEDTPWRAALRRGAELARHLGVQPRWLTPALIEAGGLARGGIRLLVLPQTLALSSAESAAIRRFAAAGGTILADGQPGQFDQHGKRLETQPLRGVPLHPLDDMASLLPGTGIDPGFALLGADGGRAVGVEARVSTNGGVTLLGLLGDQPTSRDVVLSLPSPAFVYDLRRHRVLGRNARLPLSLDADGVALLAIAPAPLPPPTITGLGHGAVRVALAGRSPARTQILRLEARDPQNRLCASANVRVAGDPVVWRLPVGNHDLGGDWTVEVVDVMSGQQATVRFPTNGR